MHACMWWGKKIYSCAGMKRFVGATMFHFSVVCLYTKKTGTVMILLVGILATIIFVEYVHIGGARYLWRYLQRDNQVYSRTGDVVVRAVFLDDRPRYGHQRVAVFLVEMRKTIIERSLIVGCTVGRRTGRSFRIFQLSLNTWLHRDRSYLTHDFVLLECYDLPPVDNSSVAFITYNISEPTQNNPGEMQTISVQSERPF